MTTSLKAPEVVKQIQTRFPGAVTEVTDTALVVDSKSLVDVMSFLKDTAGLDFNYMTTVTAIDYFQYFEVVYNLVSMEHNHSLTVKTRVYGRDNPKLPSVVSLWRSADHQEREIYDLMGITFEGHPNMKRIVLWPEFRGHPQRKDYLK
ncbi:MAG: NADH-quinone oxidoreductase subunit C [Dehalococcoidales bacterium]|nr:NADH-quinone oxidoreductase subunit C [Dehalococcoidales bacterium]